MLSLSAISKYSTLRGHLQMMSAKSLGIFRHPPPCWYQIHATSLPLAGRGPWTGPRPGIPALSNFNGAGDGAGPRGGTNPVILPSPFHTQYQGYPSGVIFALVLWSHLKKKNSPQTSGDCGQKKNSPKPVPTHGTWRAVLQ